ncbi:F-box protein [Pyrus ussuriensis x Pyrus communis]|uniref:F-box protein n=1 Tax=Pyrus ussuriensis x Pyrus communis TaxID=2448454 RepID=A0A5N5F4F1_9ROSA|nr:F-box protein At4g00755 [Pyrus x bretschneideri]KAB2597633.1 F-box protein [Pyrus ussuriensis x Pyrus communis]
MDFLNWLEPDMSFKVLTCFDDQSDLVRVSSVSRSWRHFVIENGLCKKLCLRMFPQLSRVAGVVELNSPNAQEFAEVGSSNSKELETLEREHRVYAFLARGFISFDVRSSISEAISASSTDNNPEETIHNTLQPRDMVGRRASYWSSKGQSDPAVPEFLIYKLVSDLVVINEISIHPFQAFFQAGLPIYSTNAVRFRMGHVKSPVVVDCDSKGESCHENKFVWTYTSEVFRMTQENRLQTFKLPEPVLCIGGILQIELLGRVQRQEMDGLFYICVCHVEVKGKPLSPAFGVEIHEPSGEIVLKNDVQAKLHNQPPENESVVISTVNFENMGDDMLPVENIEGEYEWEEEEGSDEEYFL